MKMQKPKKDPKQETYIKKIKKMYQNYGINTANMAEDELDRLYEKYRDEPKALEKDLKDSEKFSIVFADDIIG